METKKLRNSVITGAMAGLLFVGSAIASYTVITMNDTDSDLVEPISAVWVTELPDPTFPNQTYVVRLDVVNSNDAGNGDQVVGIKVSSANLTELNVNDGSGWGDSFDTLYTFTMVKGETRSIYAEVKVPSDQDPTLDPDVSVVVTRE